MQSTHTVSKKKCINIEYQEKKSAFGIFLSFKFKGRAIWPSPSRFRVSYSNRSLLKNMALYRHNMCNTCYNHENRSLLVYCPLLKKWHFLYLVCSVHEVTITPGLRYRNRSLLKKWNFPDLIRPLPVITMRIEGF